jgi:hypothetical protein
LQYYRTAAIIKRLSVVALRAIQYKNLDWLLAGSLGKLPVFFALFTTSIDSINSIESNDYDMFYHDFITVLSPSNAVVKVISKWR